jgi:membrane protein DedA with SNARE-associated domain
MSLEELGRHIVEFVRTHESWAAPIAFALAFAESLAFVSLILPSWAALVGIGALMKTGGLEFVQVWIAAAIGAALGDWLSYWIGTKFKNSIARTWPFSHHPQLLLRGEAFIKNWGGLAIFMGRFSGRPCLSLRVSWACLIGGSSLRTSVPPLYGQRSFWRSAISAP